MFTPVFKYPLFWENTTKKIINLKKLFELIIFGMISLDKCAKIKKILSCLSLSKYKIKIKRSLASFVIF
jgi:hypothetical protein